MKTMTTKKKQLPVIVDKVTDIPAPISTRPYIKMLNISDSIRINVSQIKSIRHDVEFRSNIMTHVTKLITSSEGELQINLSFVKFCELFDEFLCNDDLILKI